MSRLKLGYFTQFDIQVSTTFIYDLIKDLKSEEDLSVQCYNGGLGKEATFNSKSIGYSIKNLNWIYRLSWFASLLKQPERKIQLALKKSQAFKLLERHVDQNIDVAYVDFATTAVLLMDFFHTKHIPFVVHVHGYDITEKINNTAYACEVKRLFHLAGKFITASAYMKRRLILLGCPEEKIEVIRYGVEDDSIKIMKWEEKKHTPPSIIFLGRLTAKKSPLALIRAFYLVQKAMPQVKLTIIGDGPQRKDVEKLIEELKLNDSVKLHGALNREKSFPILRTHWVYAQHSVTPISGDTEGFAISLAEAALHEIPVVSTIHNGITENVVDGETGFLVPEYDYEAMAMKMLELLQNPDLCQQMGRKGRENVLENNKQKVRVRRVKELLVAISTKN